MFVPILFFSLITWANCECVAPIKDKRIVGGYDTRIEDHPYQVSLMRLGWHMCGGTIIGNEWILTAAHCTESASPSSLSVRIGSSHRDAGGEVIDVTKIFVHPKYNPSTVDYDYSLIQLARPIKPGVASRPICLPAQGEEFDEGTITTITGWGITGSGAPSTNLQAVSVNLVSKDHCLEAYGKGAITDRMLCAGVEKGGKDSCQGDSGGPMTANGKLIGIVSWGKGCAQPSTPGVYAKVSDQIDWIVTIQSIVNSKDDL